MEKQLKYLKARRTDRSLADISKIRKYLKWSPKISIEQGKNTVKTYRFLERSTCLDTKKIM